MSTQVKLGLYAVTLVGTLLFGSLFFRAWNRADAASPASAPPAARSAGTNRPAAKAPPGNTAPTNAGAVNATNTVALTNAPAEKAEAASESAEPGASEPTPEREIVPGGLGLGNRSRDVGNLILWGLLGVASLLGLGGLFAYDISQYFGQRAADALFDHDGEDLPESAYEKVEAAYGNGEFLEAVRLLREFLAENPKAVHAKIRIAEIYEKDLHNPVAATLEYEEVLKYRLDPERRGWAAIHLVNLYNRLDKPDVAVAWLQRIIAECPGTPAAGKARERLEAGGIEIPEAPAAGGAAQGGGGESSSGLPPGFRPRS